MDNVGPFLRGSRYSVTLNFIKRNEGNTMISVFTLLLLAFDVLLYAYFFVVRRSLVIKATMSNKRRLGLLLITALVFYLTVVHAQTPDQLWRGVASTFAVASFMITAQGLSDEGIVANSLGNRVVDYGSLTQVLVGKNPKNEQQTKAQFVIGRYRSPLMLFNYTQEELMAFINQKIADAKQ